MYDLNTQMLYFRHRNTWLVCMILSLFYCRIYLSGLSGKGIFAFARTYSKMKKNHKRKDF